MKYKKILFENGARLVYSPMPYMQSIAVGVWVRAGGRYENHNNHGISHFLEHMFFKGTKKRSAFEITKDIEGIGGSINAFTTEECTCYYVKVKSDDLEKAMDVLSDMIQNPLFSEKEIERERQVILEELKMSMDIPSSYVYELLRNVMWPYDSLGRMLIGTPDSIAAINRNKLKEYKNNYYHGPSIVIAMAGAIHEKTLVKVAKKKFAFLRKQAIKTYKSVKDNQNKPEVKVLIKKTEQAHLCVGIKALSRNDPDRFVLRVMNALLGENMSSRLFQRIREKKGLSYDINSSIERFSDTGAMIISAGVENMKVLQTIEAILKEMKLLTIRKVDRNELKTAQRYCIGQVALNMEKTSNQMIYIGESELCSDRILSADEIVRKIEAVDAEDIQRIAKKMFVDSKLSLAVIGSNQNEKELKEHFYLN